MREREAQRRDSNALPAVSGHFFFFFLKNHSLGASTQTLWMWSSPHPGLHSSLPPDFSSSPFIFLWFFTAAAEKREGLL